MEGENQNSAEQAIQPQPQPESQHTAPQAPPEPAAKNRPAGWVKLLIALFALSLLASALIIMRGGTGRGAGNISDKNKGAVAAMLKTSGVAWINIRGVITESSSQSPFERGAQQIATRVRTMAERDDVKAIVLDINSPGGSVGAVQAIYDEILRARNENKKPVIAVMRDVAASGGYYLAAACDRIVAEPGTMTGSIGVIFSVSNYEGLFQKIGVKMDPIKSGKHKDIGSPYRAMTPEERQMLQSVIDDAYAQFFDAVKTGRKMTDEELRPLADGRIFTGNQALKLKLIDKLGGTREALDFASKLGGLGKNPRIVRDSDAMERIFTMLDSKLSLGLLSKLEQPATPQMSYLWSF